MEVINIFAFSSVILMLTSGIVIILTSLYSKGKQRLLKALWALFNISVFLWGFGGFFMAKATNELDAAFWARIGLYGVTFTSVFFFHVASILSETRHRKFILVVIYLQGIFTSIANAFHLLTLKMHFVFNSFYYPLSKNIIYPIVYFTWILIVLYGELLLFKAYLKSSGMRRLQLAYFFTGTLIGFLGGAINFLPVYNIQIYPYSNFLIAGYCIISTYAILRYRFLDIKVAFTRAGIFVLVYTFVLGFPFWLGYVTKVWFPATSLAVFLATLGPFIYQYLRKRTENFLLKDQRHYQRGLIELSKTMSRIRDTEKLFRTVILTVIDKVKVSFAAIYLKDEEYKSYRLKYFSPKKEAGRFQEYIPLDCPLAGLLTQKKKPLLSEEVGNINEIKLDSGLVIPCFIEDSLLGFLILGPKPGNQIYTADDIFIFEALSYSTSLAIENSQFWKEIEDRQRKARLQEMDTYSYSLAHEIDNPIQVVIGQTEFLERCLLKYVTNETDHEQAESAIFYTLESARRVSGMVKAIRDFGQKTTGELTPLNIEDVVDTFNNLYYPKFKEKTVFFEKTSNLENPVFVLGEKPQLMQVLFILADNSIHAMTGLKERRVSLKIEAANHDRVRIIFSDNGYGIKKEILEIIFAPFTTTKASSEGTGMGLYNAKNMVQRHKGRIWAESEGEGKGATFFIELPIVKDVEAEELKKKDSKIMFIKPPKED